MAKQKRIYYLTSEQYAILYNDGEKDGSFEKNGVTYTYDENATYYVQTENKNKLEPVFNFRRTFQENNDTLIDNFSEEFSSVVFQEGRIYWVKVETEDGEQSTFESITHCIYNSGFQFFTWHGVDKEPSNLFFCFTEDYNGGFSVSFHSSSGWAMVDITIYETQFHL